MDGGSCVLAALHRLASVVHGLHVRASTPQTALESARPGYSYGADKKGRLAAQLSLRVREWALAAGDDWSTSHFAAGLFLRPPGRTEARSTALLSVWGKWACRESSWLRHTNLMTAVMRILAHTIDEPVPTSVAAATRCAPAG